MIKYIIILIILVSSKAYSVGGSNYSAFGLGDFEQVQGAAFWGAGGTSIGVPDKKHINLMNPAMWSYNDLTRMQLGYRFQQNLVQGEDKSLFQNFGAIDGLNLVFTLDTARGLTLAFGLTSFTHVNFAIASNFSSQIDGLNVSGKLENFGGGGIKKIYVGGSYKLFDFLSLGIIQNGFIGNVQRDAVTITNESYAHNSFTGRKNSFSGGNQKIGLNLNHKNLSFGAFYETAAKLKINSELIYISYYDLLSTGRRIVDTTFTDNSVIDLPSSYGIGFSYLDKRVRYSADFFTQDFTNFSFNKPENVEFRALNSFSVGIERMGSDLTGSKPLDKFSYRAGLGYKQLNITVNNQAITEQFATIGLTAPFGQSSIFDFAFVFGSRGQISSPMVQEIFGRFYFNVSIGEQWFVPFKREFSD